MVLQKRVYYGFDGYQVPPMPRGSRSARGKRTFPKKDKESQLCPIEMLAMVAGKLLLEKETLKVSTTGPGCSKLPKSNIKQEIWEDEKHIKPEPCDQGSCDESTLASEKCQARNSYRSSLKEYTRDSNSVRNSACIALKSEMSMKTSDELKFPLFKPNNDVITDYFMPISEGSHAETYSPGTAESHVTQLTKAEDETKAPLQMSHQSTANNMDRTAVNLYCMEDPMILDSKLPSIDGSDSSIEAPLDISRLFPTHNGNMEIVDRDDDENSSRCTIPSTINSNISISDRTEDRKIKKLLESKFWKVGPTLLRDGESSNNDVQVKPIFRSRRMCYTRQRSQRSSFKRKRLLERGPTLISNIGLGNGTSFEIANKDSKKEATNLYGDQKTQFNSEDYKVKFSIKSFKVPEISIEMPESATVGALKRAVLEAVTAILHDGIRVGVIYQGKKVKDDNKTLLQAGLPSGIKPDSMGFYLEPISWQPQPQPVGCRGSHFHQQHESESVSRLPVGDMDVLGSTNNHRSPDTECPGSYSHYADKPGPEPSATSTALADDDNSKALLPVAAMTMEPLAVVPLQRKSKRSELVQRRIRRPFSVAEVEALVQAVEVLGTGRWRDVKLRAFEDAKHRTYVDLKDKWKTLVHTARISPQQRRGEPVPQDLLDRVLAAHAYWSHQQAKLQVKQHQTEQNLLL